MSKKFIFNRKLNRRRPIWYIAFAFVIGVVTFGVVGKEAGNVDKVTSASNIDFVDPQATTAQSKTSTLSGIDFNRSGQSANVIVKFNGAIPAISFIEAQGKVDITFDDTALADDQLVEIDVKQFGTAVNSLETFEESGKSRLEVNYEGNVKIEKNEMANEVVFTLAPLSKEEVSLFVKYYKLLRRSMVSTLLPPTP
jgi:type IV pilus assembly protein PilQ